MTDCSLKFGSTDHIEIMPTRGAASIWGLTCTTALIAVDQGADPAEVGAYLGLVKLRASLDLHDPPAQPEDATGPAYGTTWQAPSGAIWHVLYSATLGQLEGHPEWPEVWWQAVLDAGLTEDAIIVCMSAGPWEPNVRCGWMPLGRFLATMTRYAEHTNGATVESAAYQLVRLATTEQRSVVANFGGIPVRAEPLDLDLGDELEAAIRGAATAIAASWYNTRDAQWAAVASPVSFTPWTPVEADPVHRPTLPPGTRVRFVGLDHHTIAPGAFATVVPSTGDSSGRQMILLDDLALDATDSGDGMPEVVCHMVATSDLEVL